MDDLRKGDKVQLHKRKGTYLVLYRIETPSGAFGWWLYHQNGYYVAAKDEQIAKVVKRAKSE